MILLYQVAISFCMAFSNELNYLSIVDGFSSYILRDLSVFRRREAQKVFHYNLSAK